MNKIFKRLTSLRSAAIIAAIAVCASAPVMTGCDTISTVKNEVSRIISEEFNNSSESASSAESEEASQKSRSEQTSSKEKSSSSTESLKATYTMADISNLQNTDYFAPGTIEHIFDGTINKKGRATGYHYTLVADSKGEIIDGTRSEPDKNGVFTARVTVSGVEKTAFSSFYPESWTPQQVVDAINVAYEDAMTDTKNPQGQLWIGHYQDIEIDMYFDDTRHITTAYPVYQGD